MACSISDCAKAAVAKGLCYKHYQRAYRERPGVREKMRAYFKRRSARIKYALELLAEKETIETTHRRPR